MRHYSKEFFLVKKIVCMKINISKYGAKCYHSNSHMLHRIQYIAYVIQFDNP